MGLRLLAVACLVGAAFAGPLQLQTQCATRCPSSPHSKFDYEIGRKYVYNYQGINHFYLEGAKRKQKAELTGQVEIHVKSKCEFVLQMKNAKLTQTTNAHEITALIRQFEIPMPFTFEDGKINHTCPSPEETMQSRNIKKGILSTFINGMDRLDKSQEIEELDTLGTCKTKYTVERADDYQAIIEKQKDLKSCTNRHSLITSLMENEYESPVSLNHVFSVFSEEKLTCKQVIGHKVMQSVMCKEFSALKLPLVNFNNMVEFEGQVELRLIEVQPSRNMRIHTAITQDTIQYNLQEENRVEDMEREVTEHLREMCSKNTDTIDISVSKDFIELITSVKRLSYYSLQNIYNQLESGRLCTSKKLTDLFLDTLPMAGNDAAIKLMVNLLQTQKVSDLKAKLWTASLALITNPSQETITAVVPLIRNQKNSSVLLGVSAMVYRYCNQKNVHCENIPSVRDIISTLNEVLGRRCQTDDENEAIAVLKAFGNMGQLLHAEENILACAKDSDKSLRLRLAAIDAFRRINKTRPEELVRLYTDTQENYEVRIAAISSVLKHADRRQIEMIKRVAERESDEQVCAYTGTLISNLNKTSSPLKTHVKQLLSEIEIQTPNVGYWENSKNIELSTYNELLNLGGGVETDVIHAPHSKIPRSLYTRFDLDVFDKHINVFELGLRAEGLEAAFKRLIGFHEAKKQKSSWNFLQSSNDIEDEKVEAAFFFRTMNTEIFDISVDDLTSMSEMIKIADILNKISHDRSADFSHSFMFMNSHLIIPSVTGRSYSFGLTGSATVGLTASSKVDIVNILSKQKNADVHGHFQPSVNVELAATVGIHSDKPRPDVKIVTRLHSESDIEAQFKIKDGHLGLMKVVMPSENVVFTRLSSDIIEIDAEHQEKQIYENMQTKVDHCFDKLQKPLGISVCAKWEVPRPFMSKTFPFVKGVGNLELSIKKTDIGMKGYELSFEIPKHKSHHMKYTASLDTPGSNVNRRFSADLEVQIPSREQRHFTLNLQSPFRSRSASANGYLTMRKDLIETSMDVQAGSSPKYTIKASSLISGSSSQKTYKPSIQISSHSSEPLTVDGYITVTNGRKQKISFDLKSNKPIMKPLTLKGTIVKDGKLDFSNNAAWKLSTDVDLNTPIAVMQISSSTEMKSGQAQTLSTSHTINYKNGIMPKESVKFTANIHKNYPKLSSVTQLEMTEFPNANFLLTYNMQSKARTSLKTDITLKYGRNPEEQYINILQSSKMHESQPGEFKIAVKAPQFDIDSDLHIMHNIKSKSEILADVDFRYKPAKHIKAKFQLDNTSKRNMNLKVKAEVQTPSRRIMYQDEIKETSPNTYRGNAVFEWQLDRRAELQYKYQKLSDLSKMHHEIETTLMLPNTRSPIKNRMSVQVSQQNVGIMGYVRLDSRSEYSLQAHLNRIGSSHIDFKMPKLESKLKIVNTQDKKVADLDLRLNLFKRPRHVIASTILGMGNQKKLEVEVSLDADNRPEEKLHIASTFEKQHGQRFSSNAKLQLSDKLNIEMSSSGSLNFYGNHDASFQASLFKQAPFELSIRHEMTPRNMNSLIKIFKNYRQKLEIAIDGSYSKTRNQVEISTSGSVKSFDNSFQTKKWATKGSFSRLGSSIALNSNVKLEMSPSKVYESEITYDLQPDIVLMKGYLHTPHINFQKQAIGFTLRKSRRFVASSASIELPNGKSIAIASETQRKENGLSSLLTVKSSFNIVRDMKMLVSWENQESQKTFKSHMDLNGARQGEVELSIFSPLTKTEIKGRVKVAQIIPEFSTNIILEKNRESFKYDIKIMKGSLPLMSTTFVKQLSNQQYSYSLQSTSQEKTLVKMKLSKEHVLEGTKHILEAQGPFPETTLYIEAMQTDKNSLSVDIQACKKSERKLCFSGKAYHKSLTNEENYRYYRKLTFDITKSFENLSPEHIANVNVIASVKGNDYREKFIVETKEKKLGYEFVFHHSEHEQDHCMLDSHIFMPNRVLRIRGSALHNQKSLLLDFEVIPDAAVLSRKFGFELSKEHQGKEVAGFVKIIYPGLKDAILFSGQVQREGNLPVEGKLKLDYSAIGGKIIILEIVPERQRMRQEKRSIQYKLYNEDKTVNIVAKLTKRLTMHENEFIYEWNWQTQQTQKKGKLSMKLSDIRNGKPESVEIEVITPRISSKLSSHIVWGPQIPSTLLLTLECNNERLIRTDIKSDDNCWIVSGEVKSRKFMKNQICIGKQENEKLKLISLQSYHRSQQSLNFEIELNSEKPQLAVVNVEFDKRSLRRALLEARQLTSELLSRYVSNEDMQYLKQICAHIQEVFYNTMEKISEHHRRYYRTVRKHFIKAKEISSSFIWDQLARYIPMEKINDEIVQPIVRIIESGMNKYKEFFYIRLPEMYSAAWENAKRNMLEFVKKYCPTDSFCYKCATFLENFEMEQTKMMISRKVSNMKRRLSEKLERVHIRNMPKWIESIVAVIEKGMKSVFEYFFEGNLKDMFIEYARRIEKFASERLSISLEKFIEWVKKIIREAERDEDFRVLKYLLKETKEKAINTWKNRETLLKQTLKPMQESLMKEFPKHWIKQKMNYSKTDFKENAFQIQFQHHLQNKHIEILKNALMAMKNKLSLKK